jgi:glycosyltransferase involved in cell wall biosynthesis
MRILSVVTLVTPDGAYGGPVRVAVNQAAALAALGHQVLMTAAVRGFAEPPTELDGVPIRLFPARTLLPGTGFAGLAAPGMLRWLRGHLTDFDVVHIHAARDLVTLPAAALARRAKLPYFLQTHGMIDPSANPLAGPLDAVLTKGLLRDAAGVFHLTGFERDQLRAVAGDLRFVPLANGVPAAEPGRPLAAPVEVLYLARLAPRKRPLAFVEAAVRLTKDFPGTRFTLVGPDEGEGPGVQTAIAAAKAAGVDLSWTGALPPERTLERMRQAGVYVLPSVDEPYPMSVLEALSVGRPVVITDTCGLADFVTSHSAGLVCDDSLESLTKAVATLLADPEAAAASGANGRAAVREELSMAAIAAELSTHYAQAVSS